MMGVIYTKLESGVSTDKPTRSTLQKKISKNIETLFASAPVRIEQNFAFAAHEAKAMRL